MRTIQRDNLKMVFSLEMTKNNGKIKISAYEKSYEDERTMKHYEFRDIDDDEIKKMCASVANILNRTNSDGKINRQALKELQTIGQLFYDSLLTGRVKEKLTATEANHLIVSVDDQLVEIPWELIFDGHSFLCQRFNMGRVVSTSQKTSEPVLRKIKKPVKMLIIADPRGDLKASYTEGIRLRDELDKNHELIQVDLQSSTVTVNFIKGALRDYDILHYAGHADYDLHNPSDGGFLMENGKLKASDIIDMIGPRPLPSLVFSNACKSGHTDIWKVVKDFETEIYGLANAFLLAGAHHYIGTFWDVQDEPSFCFALDFYRELMSGAMIGEAVRNARFRLIDRYSEASVIWASYMLYGDPTTRYIDTSKIKENLDECVEKEDKYQKEKMLTRGAVKAVDEVLITPSKKRKRTFIYLVFSLFFIVTAFFIIKNYKNISFLQSSIMKDTESSQARSKRIDKLVTTLIREYKEGQNTGKPIKKKIRKSHTPTIVFMGIKAHGISETDKQYILSRITDILQNSGRVKLVERDILDKLLEELRLSASQLADQGTALKIGRILSSNLIISGSIVKERKNWQINLRIIETETTSIKGAFIENIETREKDDIAEKVGHEILSKIKANYPLQGKILSISRDTIVLSLGYEDGATQGLRMKVLSDADGTDIGELEIKAVEEKRSFAKIIKQQSKFQEGLKTKEFL